MGGPDDVLHCDACPGQAPCGSLDVTIQNLGLYHGAGAAFFELIDANGTAAKREIPITLDPWLNVAKLGSGEEARGFIAFQVDQGVPLKVLKYDLFSYQLEFEFQ